MKTIKILVDQFEDAKQQREAINELIYHPIKKRCSNCFYFNEKENNKLECVKFNCDIPEKALKLEGKDHSCIEFLSDNCPF